MSFTTHLASVHNLSHVLSPRIKYYKPPPVQFSRNGSVRCKRGRRVKSTDQEMSPEQKKRFLRVMQGRVEDAAQMLDDIIDNVVSELSSIQAIGFVYEEVPEATEQQIIRKVVKAFLPRLDQNFLASMERFEKKANEMGNQSVAILISRIAKEIMSQVQEQFPPEVLLLEDLMEISDKRKRIAKIYEANETKEVDSDPKPDEQQSKITVEESTRLDLQDLEETPIENLDLEKELQRLRVLKDEKGLKQLKDELDKTQVVIPTPTDFDEVLNLVEDNDLLEDCEPENSSSSDRKDGYGTSIDPLQLFMAANQFITDMEEKEEIANRQLLAKLCVIREEARLVDLELRLGGVKMNENPIALRENVPSQVMGVIQTCVKASDPVKRVGLIRKTFEKDVYGPSTKDLNRAPGFVRPGIFMTALTMTQMEADADSKLKSKAAKYTPEFLQRLDDIRLEAMLVLRGMAWGQFSQEELAQRQKERRERETQMKIKMEE